MEVPTESPKYIKLSLAAAMQLGYSPARFFRGAKMTCINLLLTYENGCSGNCSYCGLARERDTDGERSFIRVPWPIYPTEDVLGRIGSNRVVKRTCLSMITNGRCVCDTIALTRRVTETTKKPVSVLVNPTALQRATLQALHYAGADRVGVAFDLPTERLFEKHRGKEVKGPHRWERYWSVFQDCVSVFGQRMVGSHFIVGLGESEKEMVEAMQKVHDLGGVNHLFSFFPEKGSLLEGEQPPPIGAYRRVQVAVDLIDAGRCSASGMSFDDDGRIVDFGIPAEELDALIQSGEPFRTRGCKADDGEVACNRPYANCLPGEEIRNYPFVPEEEDIERIRNQMKHEVGCSGCVEDS